MKRSRKYLLIFCAAVLIIAVFAGCNMPTLSVSSSGKTSDAETPSLESDKDIPLEMDMAGSRGIGSRALASGMTVTARVFRKDTMVQVGIDKNIPWDATAGKYKGYANAGTYSGNIIVHVWGTTSGQIGGQGTADTVTTTPLITITSSTTYSLRNYGPGGGLIAYDKGSYSSGWRYMEAAPVSWNGGSTDPTAIWGKRGLSTTATSTAIGNATSNTSTIKNFLANGNQISAVPTLNTATGSTSWSTTSLITVVQTGGSAATFRVATTSGSGSNKKPATFAFDNTSGSAWSSLKGSGYTTATGLSTTGGAAACSVDITATAVTGDAAQIVPASTGTAFNGYSTWALPTSLELAQMYTNLKAQSVGGFTAGYYWSSSEVDAYNVAVQDFSTGTTVTTTGAASATNTKSLSTYSVRPVRYF